MATQADFDASLVELQSQIGNLAKWLGTFAADAKKMEDKRAARVAEMAWGVSKAAQQAGDAIVNLSTIINVMTSSAIHFGMTTHSFAGSVSFETDTQTVTGQTWVVDEASTPVFAFTNAEESTSDVIGNGFRMQVNNYVAGVGFDVTMKSLLTAGLPGAASWDAWWFSFS